MSIDPFHFRPNTKADDDSSHTSSVPKVQPIIPSDEELASSDAEEQKFNNEDEMSDFVPLEMYNELILKIRRMEEQHSSDKADWKLKLECSLMNFKAFNAEKEVIRTQVQEVAKENERLESKIEKLSSTNEDLLLIAETATSQKEEIEKKLSQVSAAHEKCLLAHGHEKTRLEAQIQKLKAAHGLEILKMQRTHKKEVGDLSKKVRVFEHKSGKLEKSQSRAILKDHAHLKKERDDLMQKVTVQRTQITAHKEKEKTLTQVKQQLEELEKKYGEAQRQHVTCKELKDKEMKLIRERLEKARSVEDRVPVLEQEVKNLKSELTQERKNAVRKDRELQTKIQYLQAKIEDQTSTIEKQDEELYKWKSSADKLEKNLKDLMAVESQTASSYQKQLDALLANLQKQVKMSKQKQDGLQTSCSFLKDEISAWKAQCSELEKESNNCKTLLEQKDNYIEKVLTRQGELESIISKQQADIQDWKEAATKLEKCVEDLMSLEEAASDNFDRQMHEMKEENGMLAEKVHVLKYEILALSSENAGLRMDDLGLDAMDTFEYGISGPKTTGRTFSKSTSHDSHENPADDGSSKSDKDVIQKGRKSRPLHEVTIQPLAPPPKEVIDPFRSRSNKHSNALLEMEPTPRGDNTTQSQFDDECDENDLGFSQNVVKLHNPLPEDSNSVLTAAETMETQWRQDLITSWPWGRWKRAAKGATLAHQHYCHTSFDPSDNIPTTYSCRLCLCVMINLNTLYTSKKGCLLLDNKIMRMNGSSAASNTSDDLLQRSSLSILC